MHHAAGTRRLHRQNPRPARASEIVPPYAAGDAAYESRSKLGRAQRLSVITSLSRRKAARVIDLCLGESGPMKLTQRPANSRSTTYRYYARRECMLFCTKIVRQSPPGECAGDGRSRATIIRRSGRRSTLPPLFGLARFDAVSYTHLTLPTICSV